MFIRSFLRFSGWAQLALFALMSLVSSGCSEPECPEGLIKVGKSCRRPDAGAMLDADAAGPFEAGVDPAISGDAASGAASDAAVGSDAIVAPDGASSSDAAGASADAGAVAEAGSQPDAAANLDATTPPPADAGSDAPTTCASGHMLKNGACQDIDECFEGTHQCHMTSTCKNSVGSYDCECPLGYSGGTSAGFACAPRIAVGVVPSNPHACVLLLDGTIRCWGSNQHGQLGDGTQADRFFPTVVPGLSNAVLLDAGEAAVCAVLRDGTVRCWGNNESGQLGDGSTMTRLAPVAIPQLADVVSIDLGSTHGCAVLRTGAVKCWGANAQGQLGTGSPSSTSVLSPAGVKDLSGAAMVHANQNQSCAVLRSGVALCWGEGYLNGPKQTSLAPLQVSIPASTTWVAIGAFHSCSLHSTGGTYCWGTPVLTGNPSGDGKPREVLLPGLATSIAVGLYKAFAVLRSGETVQWGDSGPVPARLDGFGSAVAVSAGILQTCVVLKDGTLSCLNTDGYAAVSGVDLW